MADFVHVITKMNMTFLIEFIELLNLPLLARQDIINIIQTHFLGSEQMKHMYQLVLYIGFYASIYIYFFFFVEIFEQEFWSKEIFL